MTQKRVGYTGDIKNSEKYGCVSTCCHKDDLPWYKCVIVLRNNYNFDIPAVAMHYQNDIEKSDGAVAMYFQNDIEKSDGRNSYANHVINN